MFQKVLVGAKQDQTSRWLVDDLSDLLGARTWRTYFQKFYDLVLTCLIGPSAVKDFLNQSTDWYSLPDWLDSAAAQNSCPFIQRKIPTASLHLWIPPYSRVTDLSLVNLEWFGIVIDFPARKTAWTSGSWKIRSKRCASGRVWWQCSRRPMIYQLTGTEGWWMVIFILIILPVFFPEHHVSSCHPPKKLAWWSGCTVHRGSPIAPIGCQACEWISISRRVAWQERPGSQAPKLYRQFSSFHLAKDSLFIFGEIKNGGAKIIELQIAIVAKLTRGRTCERTCWLGSPADLYAMVLLTGRRLSTTK